MNLRKIDKFQMDESIKLALKEDITFEDISTNAIYKNERLAEISLYSKEFLNYWIILWNLQSIKKMEISF